MIISNQIEAWVEILWSMHISMWLLNILFNTFQLSALTQGILRTKLLTYANLSQELIASFFDWFSSSLIFTSALRFSYKCLMQLNIVVYIDNSCSEQSTKTKHKSSYVGVTIINQISLYLYKTMHECKLQNDDIVIYVFVRTNLFFIIENLVKLIQPLRWYLL